jgi:hypothetical protein
VERLEYLRKAILQLLQNHCEGEVEQPDSELQMICDRERDHYQLVSLGWQGHRRFYTVLMHLDIKHGKVWIQRNETDELIAQELVAMGIAREEIVLGLQPEFVRADTGYGE